MMRASELRMLEVINVRDGRRLGHVYDLGLDMDTGRICTLILPGGGGGWFGAFNRYPEIEIPWDCVVRIGADVILVDLPERLEAPVYANR
ncbi:MAG TPA: YlmC/YmxH family sporulation protein [Limnochordia bacterium]|nr:YlmC/YmxH family sporulation protein [Limnochordia bacterium]